MRKRKEIRETLVTYLGASVNLPTITAYRVYPHWSATVPVINIITGAEEPEDEDGVMGGYVIRNMDLIFEIITKADDGGLIDDYDMEIESLLDSDSSPLESITTDGKKTIMNLWPGVFDEPEFLSEGEDPIIKTRIHWALKYIELIGGE